jgi:hypothetical protein
MNAGIHQRIAFKRAEISGSRATANDAEASAAESHDAFERLPRLERELEDLCQSAHTGENAAEQTDEMIGKLSSCPARSAELMLAIRDLETAGFRLRQHLGTKPD